MQKSAFDWNQIDNDIDFQGLIGCMLLEVVSKHAQVFVRPGKDYGIDASYTGEYGGLDGRWVFQCKFYSDVSNLKKKLKGTTKEKGEIGYLQERMAATLDTVEYKLWNGVNRFRLLTNLELLPQERQEILDLFKPIISKGVDVDIWDGAKIRLLAESNPFVIQQIFGSEVPLFVPGHEFCRIQSMTQFGQYFTNLNYVPTESLTQLKDFLNSTNTVALVRGTGGLGKTRTLIELSRHLLHDDTWHVLSIQETTESFDQQLPQIPPNKKCLILVDDAERFAHFSKLLGLATRHRLYRGRIKIVAACRGAVSKPVEMEIKKAAITEMTEVDLPSLSQNIYQLAEQLGCTGAETAVLIRVATGIPLWVVLGSIAIKNGVAIHELSREKIVRFYVERYLAEVAPEDKPLHSQCLNVLAVLEPVNIKSKENRAILAKLVNADVPRCMHVYEEILRSGFVQLRGRFLKISPDLVADYVLTRALFIEGGIPTDLHRILLDSEVPDTQRLITNLARAELVSGKSVLDDVILELLQTVRSLDNFKRIKLLHAYYSLGYVRPKQFLSLINIILSNPQPDTVITALFVIKTITHLNVLGEIPKALKGVLRWELYRQQALEIIADIAERQNFIGKFGMGASEAFEEATRFSPQMPLAFLRQHLALCDRWFSANKRNRLPLIEVALTNLLRIETREEEFDGTAVIITSGRMTMDPLIDVRRGVLNLLSQMLLSSDKEIRVTAVSVLKEGWSQINQLIGEHQAAQKASAQNRVSDQASQDRADQRNKELKYLNSQVSQIYQMLGEALEKETDNVVLEALEDFLSWDRQFSRIEEDRVRAQALTAKIYSKSAYLLYSALSEKLSTFQSHSDNLKATVQNITKESEPEKFLNEVVAIVNSNIDHCGAADLFNELGDHDEMYALRLLVAIHNIRDSLQSFSWQRAVSQIVSVLRLKYGHVQLPSYLAAINSWWRQTVACTSPVFYNAAEKMTDVDLALLLNFAADENPSIYSRTAELLRLLAKHHPDQTLAIVHSLYKHDLNPRIHTEVAQAFLRLIEIDDKYRESAIKISSAFVKSPQLDYWAQLLFLRLAKKNAEWLVGIFELRAEYSAQQHQGDGALDFEILPRTQHGNLTSDDDKQEVIYGLESAIMRTLAWRKRSDGLRFEVENMLEWIIDSRDEIYILAIVDRLISQHNLDALRSASELMATLSLNVSNQEVILKTIGQIIKNASTLSVNSQQEVCGVLGKIFTAQGWRGNVGKIPLALLLQRDNLNSLAALFPKESSVQIFVSIEIKSLDEMIEQIRERYDEIWIAGNEG